MIWLDDLLYPNDPYNEDYYYKVKNDDTGEKYFIIDWIKSHNEKIERLQDEMIWVTYKIHEIEKRKKTDDRV
jgi:hypothetical protein